MKHRFDPLEYLAANPDAAREIEEGRELSAWGHFVHGGFRDDRGGVPNEIRRTVRAVMEALLPAALPRALAGQSAGDFELGAKIAALGIYSAVVPVLHMDRPLRILDLGCGYGRLLRFLGLAAPYSAIHGVDPDRRAIAWCREALRDEVRHGRVSLVDGSGVPPLPFSPGYFDLACGVFCFPSMPERLQIAWLSELRRVTRPEGFLVLSGVRVSLASYFAVLEEVPPVAKGQPGLVLCMRHPALVI